MLVFVRLLDRRLQQHGLYISAVAVKMLVCAVAAAEGRGGGEAGDGHIFALAGNRQHAARGLAPEKRVHRRFLAPVAGGEENLLAVAL